MLLYLDVEALVTELTYVTVAKTNRNSLVFGRVLHAGYFEFV